MTTRLPFEDKYYDIPTRWNVKADMVNYIVRRYTKKLEEELKTLREEGLRLPKFFADRRTDEEYVYDLIDGWLLEDIVSDAWLHERITSIAEGVKVTHMGTNRDRSLQKYDPRKITTEPDFAYVSPRGQQVQIELQVARKARPREGYDMKESKVRRARNAGNIFLWIIEPEDSFFFVDPSYDITKEPRANPQWGGKMVYTLPPEEIEQIGKYSMVESIPEKWHPLLGF